MEVAEYARIAAVEDDHWWYKNTRALARDLLSAHLTRDQLFLDAGCGPGGNGAWLAEHGVVVGADISLDAVRFVQARWPDTLPVQASVSALPFAGGTFDVVLAITVLTCVPDDTSAIRELARLVRPDGVLLLIEPAFDGLRRAHDVTVHSLRRYRRRSLADLTRAAGLRVERATYAYSFLAPAAAVLHVAERRKLAEPPGDKGSDTERRRLDGVFAPLGRVERRWLARHNLPVGTSAVVVATKT
ncbi:MAG: class I SAM-dependent methyltransferase [Actinobacteria bacterium]|nr:class I SAM-dependent methyltransferase [Actinomycetota bacterium]